MIAQIETPDPVQRAKVLDLMLKMETAGKNAEMDDERFNQEADSVLERHAELLRKLAQ